MSAATVHESRRRPRRALIVLVVGLSLLLVALIGVLFGLLPREPAPLPAPIAGIRSLMLLSGPGIGEQPFFDAPMAAAFGKGGRIYVADTGNNRVVVFDAEGRYELEFGGLGVAKPARGGVSSWKPGLFNYPTDIATDENGDVYVADFRNDQIQVFDAEGRFLRAFPDRGKVVGRGASGQEGTGIAVTSVAVRDGMVYATDTYQVVLFDTDGAFKGQFGRPGSGPLGFDHPNGIAAGEDSELYVSDSNNNRVVAVSLPGTFVWSVGEHVSDARTSSGPFEVPRGITVAGNDTLVIADALASTLVRVTTAGAQDGVFGQRGDLPGELNFPTDVDSLGERLLVAEKGNNRVQVLVLEDAREQE